jgi:hypothetical protein
MGDAGEAMTPSPWPALLYEGLLWAFGKWPKLARSPWAKAALAHCFHHWLAWKTRLSMESVDRQAEEVKKQWERGEREEKAQALTTQAQALFPEASVEALPDAPVPSVLIEHEAPEGASDAVKALGGEMRITYRLSE